MLHGRHQTGGKRALEQPDCDERRIRADERRLHLAEEMHVVAAHRQQMVATLQVNLRSFIVMSLDHG
jgi:hypothetical protein